MFRQICTPPFVCWPLERARGLHGCVSTPLQIQADSYRQRQQQTIAPACLSLLWFCCLLPSFRKHDLKQLRRGDACGDLSEGLHGEDLKKSRDAAFQSSRPPAEVSARVKPHTYVLERAAYLVHCYLQQCSAYDSRVIDSSTPGRFGSCWLVVR